MQYMKAIWLTANDEEPVLFYHEINVDAGARDEKRRVEQYKDGRTLRTDKIDDAAEISLSWERFATLEEIQSQPEFVAFEISQTEFEAVWQYAEKTI